MRSGEDASVARTSVLRCPAHAGLTSWRALIYLFAWPPRVCRTSEPLDCNASDTLEGPQDDPQGLGAVTSFVGLVRDHNVGRRVLWLDYEAYAPLALRSFERIAAETRERWPGASVAIHHRTGSSTIGEASVVIAAASPHRADAFAACRYAIERVKQIAPIWKHEHFEGGEVVDRRRDGRSGRRGGAGWRRSSAHARDVRLFARLRELAGRRELRASCRDGGDRRYGLGSRWSREFPEPRRRTTRAISAAVNAEYARMTRPLHDGDEVAFLPPVSGRRR